jgi:hypothetical protein
MKETKENNMKLPFSLWSNDVGKKVYKVTQTYLLTVEQYVKAEDKDQAFDIILDKGGIKHDRISRLITEEDFEVCETTYVDVDTPDTKFEYKGTIVKEEDNIKCDDLEPEFKDTVIPFNKQFGRHV